MIRILEERTFVEGKKFIGAAGKSTDTKPETDLVTGSVFVEVDTGDVYFFDETAAAGSRWKKV
jgi:hypothetical protein